MPLLRLALLTLLAVAMFATPPASAATCDRFAAPDGSNRAAGSAARPFRTAQRLANSLRPGQTGCLRRGNYRAARGEDWVVEFERRGRRKAPITLRNHPGERARLTGIVMVERGADHVRIAGLEIVGTGVENTVKVYAANTVIEGNDITNRLRGDSCMIIGSDSGGRARRTIVRRNRFRDCGATANENYDHSIYAANVKGARIVGNTFSNSAAYTIQLYPNADRSYVARNVIDGGPDTVRGGIVIGGDSRHASSHNVVERNVIAHAATGSVATSWDDRVGKNNLVRDNCLWQSGDQDDVEGLDLRGNVVGNPAGSSCLSVLGR